MRSLLVLVAIFMSFELSAGVPNVLSHQGKVMVGGKNFTGTGTFKFALVNSDGSATYWRNSSDTTGDGVPDNAVSVNVQDGLYSVTLGDTGITNMEAIGFSVFTNSSVWLRVWFNDGTTGWERLTPDQRVTPVGYAMQAAGVNGALYADNDGNVGIGTTDPENPFEVYSSNASHLKINESEDTDGQLYNNSIMNTRAHKGDRNYLKFKHGETLMAYIYSESKTDEKANLNVYTKSNSHIYFGTHNTFRMILTNTGYLGLGTEEPQYPMEVDGQVKATEFVTSSDARLKKDITPINEALLKVKEIQGVYYKMKIGSQKREIGFIGQDLEKQLPEVVSTDKKGYKAVSYQKITPLLVEAVKEQQEIIDAQQALLQEQKTAIETLRNKLDILERKINK